MAHSAIFGEMAFRRRLMLARYRPRRYAAWRGVRIKISRALECANLMVEHASTHAIRAE
jgi:hypothetical protein